MTAEVQHTLKVRIDKQIVTINCPPFASIAQLESLLAEYKATHPGSTVVSKSWSSNAA